jgi:tetratricopeptide (TPR) repeat protein
VEEYRRRGFATITAADAVEYALSNEFAVVGWHTHDHNHGSIGTAEKIGFEKEREYEQYFCMFNEALHYAESGMKLFFNENYERALEDLERSFKLGEVPHWAYYLAARISTKSSDFDKALDYLVSAARLGYEYIDHLLSNEEFVQLHTRPEWSDIVTQIESNAKED